MSYADAVTYGELYKALRKVKNGVMWKDSTARYVSDGLKETYRLRQELLRGDYRIRPYRRFIVTDPKRREVMATQIRDRQLQRSLCDNGLYDAITRSFIRDNFACQVGRGVDDALDRMDAHLHRYYRQHGADGWVLKCDIRHYFAETPHETAKAAIRKRVEDARMCAAVEQIVDSFGGGEGIGLGSQVSQLIQLAVLDDLDHFIKERLRVKHYLRYMDDFVLIHPDKTFLIDCHAQIRERLATIGLELNGKTQIFPLRQGITWLQWRFRLTKTGKVLRRIGRRNVTRQRRRLRRMKRLTAAGELTKEDAWHSLQSWAACAARGNTSGAVRSMLRLYFELFEGDAYDRHGTDRPPVRRHNGACGYRAGAGGDHRAGTAYRRDNCPETR